MQPELKLLRWRSWGCCKSGVERSRGKQGRKRQVSGISLGNNTIEIPGFSISLLFSRTHTLLPSHSLIYLPELRSFYYGLPPEHVLQRRHSCHWNCTASYFLRRLPCWNDCSTIHYGSKGHRSFSQEKSRKHCWKLCLFKHSTATLE